MTLLDFTSARWDGTTGELCLKPINVPAVLQWLVKHDEKKTYTCEIKERRKKRSLDANAYFWVLVDKLAAATGEKKEDIYRRSIREIGGVSDTVCVTDKAVNKLMEIWSSRGLGWFCESFQSKIPGCTNITLYRGSSTFDTAQMARLIDNVIQDCDAVGIDTMTPKERALLLDDWGNRDAKE